MGEDRGKRKELRVRVAWDEGVLVTTVLCDWHT